MTYFYYNTNIHGMIPTDQKNALVLPLGKINDTSIDQSGKLQDS